MGLLHPGYLKIKIMVRHASQYDTSFQICEIRRGGCWSTRGCYWRHSCGIYFTNLQRNLVLVPLVLMHWPQSWAKAGPPSSTYAHHDFVSVYFLNSFNSLWWNSHDQLQDSARRVGRAACGNVKCTMWFEMTQCGYQGKLLLSYQEHITPVPKCIPQLDLRFSVFYTSIVWLIKICTEHIVNCCYGFL